MCGFFRRFWCWLPSGLELVLFCMNLDFSLSLSKVSFWQAKSKTKLQISADIFFSSVLHKLWWNWTNNELKHFSASIHNTTQAFGEGEWDPLLHSIRFVVLANFYFYILLILFCWFLLIIINLIVLWAIHCCWKSDSMHI